MQYRLTPELAVSKKKCYNTNAIATNLAVSKMMLVNTPWPVDGPADKHCFLCGVQAFCAVFVICDNETAEEWLVKRRQTNRRRIFAVRVL